MFDKKILCLGTNSDDTDLRTSLLAVKYNTVNYGLVDDDSFVPSENGYYHTSLTDLSSGNIVRISSHFDEVVLLDQPYEQWSHWKIFSSTVKLMEVLEDTGIMVTYKDNENVKSLKSLENLIDNGSFCIYPWILHIMQNKKVRLCARSTSTITTQDQLGSWRDDPVYSDIRQKMLNGEKIPKLCDVCYEQESQGIESYRTFETKEWIAKLNIQTVNDLNKIEHPHYYEVRLNNLCNIACRGCRPSYSSRIETEYKKFEIEYPYVQKWDYSDIDIIDINTLSPKTRVYLTGGEPTIMKEVNQFMKDCIGHDKTDFDFTLGTNAVKLTEEFLDLSKHFTNMNFSVSIDGYGIINDYWRWGSKWSSLIENTKKLEALGHTISINCVPGIYNVTNLHLLLEFLDIEFPKAGLYLQINYHELHSACNHPNAKMVIDSMERCRNTNQYYVDGKSVRTCIDTIHSHYSNSTGFNVENLRKFFEYNDKQDNARKVKLGDYIPELEECRKYIK